MTQTCFHNDPANHATSPDTPPAEEPSEAFVALGGQSPVTKLSIDQPRNVIGFELKESYYRAALDYVKRARRQRARRELDGKLF